MCLEHLERIQKTAKQIEEISELTSTADQADGESGEWMMLHREYVTASFFGDIVKRRASTSFGSLVMKLYGKQWITPTIQYGHRNEPVACDAYIVKQADEYNRTVFVSKTGLLIDCLLRIMCM